MAKIKEVDEVLGVELDFNNSSGTKLMTISGIDLKVVLNLDEVKSLREINAWAFELAMFFRDQAIQDLNKKAEAQNSLKQDTHD